MHQLKKMEEIVNSDSRDTSSQGRCGTRDEARSTPLELRRDSHATSFANAICTQKVVSIWAARGLHGMSGIHEVNHRFRTTQESCFSYYRFFSQKAPCRDSRGNAAIVNRIRRRGSVKKANV